MSGEFDGLAGLFGDDTGPDEELVEDYDQVLAEDVLKRPAPVGRPRKVEVEPHKMMSPFKTPKRLVDAIGILKVKTGRSRRDLLTEALEDFVRKHEDLL